jgi:hypothetical protein
MEVLRFHNEIGRDTKMQQKVILRWALAFLEVVCDRHAGLDVIPTTISGLEKAIVGF